MNTCIGYIIDNISSTNIIYDIYRVVLPIILFSGKKVLVGIKPIVIASGQVMLLLIK